MIPADQRSLDTASRALDRELFKERARHFETNRWIGPIGLTAATVLYDALVSRHPQPPDRLRFWTALVLLVIVMQIVGFLNPRIMSIRDRSGVPIASIVTQGLLGVAWGATLWLDAASVADPEFRWTTLAAMFAISGGASAGLSGVNSLGRWLIVPMWTIASTSLLVHGHASAAVAVVIYLGITVRDMRENGTLWAELIGRRLQATRDAEASATAAARDPLTGLLNHSGFVGRLSQRSTTHGADVETATILFIDLDHFKSVNDRYGHRTGDLVLIEVAERLRRCLRTDDAIARIGGDEFCALLGGVEHRTRVMALAERIVAELASPVRTSSGDAIDVTASVGVAEMSTVHIDVEQLLMDADHAMYQAKRRGRNQVVYFDEDLQRDLTERSRITASLRHAIRNQTLTTSNVPLLEGGAAIPLAIDLFACWHGNDLIAPEPQAILAMAIEHELMADLAALLLRQAAALQRHCDADPELSQVRISFAVSTKSVLRWQIRDRIDEAITEHGLDPARLSLRLAGLDVPIAQRPDLVAPFHELTRRGITLELDDVGRGDGSIGNLLALPISTVRLDPSITDAIETSPSHTAIIESIVGLCRSLEQTVIAVGVGDPARATTLQAMGVTTAQRGEPILLHESIQKDSFRAKPVRTSP